MRSNLQHRSVVRSRRAIALMAVIILLLALASVAYAAGAGPNGVAGVRLIDRVYRPSSPLGKSTIGNYVWHDANADGDHVGAGNASEVEFTAGISGVALELWRNDPILGWVKDADTTTDATGKYSFPATADATQYEVRVAASNFASGGALVGYVLTSATTYPQPFTMPNVPIFDYVNADFGYAKTSLEVTKAPATQTLLPGSTATFNVTIKNTGEVYVKNIVLTDNVTGVTCVPSTFAGPLAPNATVTAVCTDTDVQAAYTNTVSVTGTPSDENGGTLPGSTPKDDSNTVEVLLADPKIQVVKEVWDGNSWNDANTITGPAITSGTSPKFRFTITNTGNVTLSSITLTDSDFTFAAGECVLPATLAPAPGPGNTYSCEIERPWAAGQHTDTATTTGSYTDGQQTSTPSDTDDANYFGAAPKIQVLKEVWDGAAWYDANSVTGPFIPSGTNPKFRFTITNTGNVTLSAITLADSDFTFAAGECALPATLAPTASYSCEITRPWAAGQHTDTATTTGSFTDDGGVTATPEDTDDANYFGANPALKLVKTAGTAPDGSILTVSPPTPPATTVAVMYTYVVTNEGNLPLFLDKAGTDPTYGVTDDKCSPVTYESGDTDDDGLLDLTETWTFKCAASLSQDTVNTGTAVGQPADPTTGQPLPNVPDAQDTDTAEVQIHYGVGDLVWWDVNGNGVQDAGEPGIPGVNVTLGANTDPTDSNGLYEFLNVPPGPYSMVIPAGDLASGGPLAGFTPTTPNVGDPAKDSNGALDGSGNVVASFTLPAGASDMTIDFGFIKPTSYKVEKTLVSTSPVAIGREVHFQIKVTNDGSTWIDTLPLVDTYSTTYLTYGFNVSFATPASDDNNDDGVINWTDITGAGSLAPGGSVTVDVYFTAKADTTALLPVGTTINTATVPQQGTKVDADGPNGPIPPANSPVTDKSAEDDVQIINPTGVLLANARLSVTPQGVTVEWQTADETKMLGFNVLRGMSADTLQPVNAELILAQFAGANGSAAYSFTDAAAPGYLYALEVIGLDGSVTRIELGH